MQISFKNLIILALLVIITLALVFYKKECFMSEKKLEKYKSKRNFKETPEPKGEVKKSKKKPIFVIQKHDASRLHYDLRLEIDGVLVSWAVPKGPSLNPQEKRLAIMTEDHPMEYGKFEGVIPEGNYGAGPVMIWDHGTYTNIKEKDGKIIPMNNCLQMGTIEVDFHGQRIKGKYALVKLKGKDKQWLLIKMNDDHASKKKNPVSTENKSVVSGKTMTEIKKTGKIHKGCSS